MQEIRLWYNQHRKKIWITVGIIAAFIIIIQLLNFFTAKINNNIEEVNTITENDVISEIKNETNVDVESAQSVVSGETISTEKLKSETEIIGEFMDYCNQGNTEAAYGLLTDDCKEQMYNSLDAFNQAYYQDVFDGEQKIYSVENWVGDIYRVKISENMLATGKSNNGYSKQDYITVKETGEGYKLNINSYIGHEEINKITEDNNIVVEVISKNTYMDREEYTIRVTNNNDTAITLDAKSNTESLYLENDKEGRYPAYTHELTDPMLNIDSGSTRELTIKFYCRYTSTANITDMVFSNLIIYNNQGSEIIEFRVKV